MVGPELICVGEQCKVALYEARVEILLCLLYVADNEIRADTREQRGTRESHVEVGDAGLDKGSTTFMEEVPGVG
jgi:hypothetical protein